MFEAQVKMGVASSSLTSFASSLGKKQPQQLAQFAACGAALIVCVDHHRFRYHGIEVNGTHVVVHDSSTPVV
jgi:hypothetical protein